MVICYICRTKSLIVIKKCCQKSAADENRWRFLFTFAHSLINGGGLLQSVGCGNPFFWSPYL